MTGRGPKIQALVGYPLSSEYRARLEEILGLVPDYISVAELRRMPPKGLVRALWYRPGGTTVIPLEDDNSVALLPILETLAALSGARRIEIVFPDLSRKRVSRGTAMIHLGRMLKASVASRRSASRCQRELEELLHSRRVETSLPNNSREVLYLKTNLWFGVKAGGSVGHIAGVVNGLLDYGYEIVFAAAEEPVMLKNNVRFLKVQPPRTFGLPSELNYYRFQERFIKQVNESSLVDKPDFIYQRLSVANYTGVVLSRRMGVPLVLEYNGSEAWIAKHWGNPLRYHDLAVLAEKVSLRHAHLIVTISEVLRDELLERGVDPKRIVLYPNCVDPEVFDPERFSNDDRAVLRHQYGIDRDARLVTFVGTFGQWHGAEVFARAIRRFAEEKLAWMEERKVRFMLVGDGLKMSEVRKEITGSAAERFVTLTGLVEQNRAPLYLATSDVLVSPHVPNTDGSRFFGSPTKLFEYMSMGKGIVASNLEQIGDVLRPGIRIGSVDTTSEEFAESAIALLVEPGDEDELMRSIQLLVEREDMCVKLGENSRERVLERYTWKHHVNAIIDVLQLN